MAYTSNVEDTNELSKYYIGFPKGLNTIQDSSLIDDKNLSACLNAVLEVDGIKRRPGTDKVFGTGSASYVYGAAPFYKKSAASRYFLRMAKVSDTVSKLQKLDTDHWDNVSDVVTWGLDKTCFVQARDKMFIHNGTDSLRYFDGTSITTYTELTTPTNLAVAATGSTGSTAYSYRVEAVNATGRTAACARVAIANGNATLSATNYNALTWTAVSGATGYNIYGRTQTGLSEQYLDTVYVTSYNDTGVDAPAIGFSPNEYNTTGGIKAKYAIFTLGRQFAIGVTEGSIYYPTRIYYSGTLNYVDAFVGGDYGGGWVDIKSNDGGEIIDIAPYQNGVLILKTNGIFKFYFTSAGLPAVDEIAISHGAVSNRGGKLIDNDYVYVAQKDNRIAVMTVGQQANYVGDQLRTNDISIFISDGIGSVNRSSLTNICTFLYDYKFGFTFTKIGQTENTEGFILDTRFGGWVKWDGLPMQVTHWTSYDDGTNIYLYGCSNTDGSMIRMFETATNDDGAAFVTSLSTKAFNQGMFNVKKVYRNPSLWFKYISGGNIDIEVYVDGNRKTGTASIAPSSSGTMVGIDLFGEALFGSSAHAIADAISGSDYPQELTMLQIARSLKFNLTDSNINTNWLFMGVNVLYSPLLGMPLDQQYKVYIS